MNDHLGVAATVLARDEPVRSNWEVGCHGGVLSVTGEA